MQNKTTYTLTVRVIEDTDDIKRGIHYVEVIGINWLQAVDRFRRHIGYAFQQVKIDVVASASYGPCPVVHYDRQRSA